MRKSAQLLDGRILAEQIKKDLAQVISKSPDRPGLAVVMVGDDPSSTKYIKLKEKACYKVGMDFHQYKIPAQYTAEHEQEVLTAINFLNQDPTVDGIIVQLPLPAGYPTDAIIAAIDPTKDADGFVANDKSLVPPTIASVIELLRSTGQSFADKKTIVIGKSDIFIDRLDYYLRDQLKIEGITTADKIPTNSTDYDIIIIAIGQAHSLKKEMVKEGAIVIDIGINIVNDQTLGDVDPNVIEVASYLSPVPGGVGPLTVACLLDNVYQLFSRK